MYNAYILGWDASGNKIFDKQIFPLDKVQTWYVHLDVGNLSHKPGDEIVITDDVFGGLIDFYWNGRDLVQGLRFPIYADVAFTNVFISGMDSSSDSKAEVLVCGRLCKRAEVKDGEGGFYLEVLGFDNGFFSKWRRIAGNSEEKTVAYGAFGKKKE